MSYAEKTQVPVSRTKGEIEELLSKYGASGFASGWQHDRATIMFQLDGRTIKFVLPLAPLSDFATKYDGRSGKHVPATPEYQQKAWEQSQRQKWRALLLCIKAKLEACSSGITTLEHEFLAHFVHKDGKTVGEILIPQLDSALVNRNHLMLGQ